MKVAGSSCFGFTRLHQRKFKGIAVWMLTVKNEYGPVDFFNCHLKPVRWNKAKYNQIPDPASWVRSSK
jgi:hypothetical protein